MAEQTKLRVLIETPGIGQLSKLRGSLTQVDVAAKGLGNNFAKARIELKRVEQTTKPSINSTRALRDSFRELANSVEFGSGRFKVATREAERLDKQLAKMQEGAEQTKLRVLIETPGIDQLSKLRGSLTQVDVAAKGLGNNFAKVRVELKRTEQTSKRTVNSTRALRDSFRELANSVEFGSKKFRIATREAERLDKQLARMERRKGVGRIGGLKGAAQIAGTIAGAGVFGGAEGALGSAIGAGFGPQGAIVGGAIGAQVGQLRQALGATAEYAAELQKLRIALVGVTTSNAEYATALDAITQATQDYALPQDVVTRQFTKLQASVQGAGGNIDDTRDAFDGIVSAVRATGGSLADVDAALTATAQVFSKGKVSAEELRQQIGERLPGAFTLFAESMGKTPQELDKALEKGEVSLQDFMNFVRKITERYKENAKAIADSPAAAGDRLKRDLGNLSESVGRLLAPIGAGFQKIFSEIASVILGATEALNRFLGLAFDEEKYQTALMQIADYEARKMHGGLPSDKRARGAADTRYFQALEIVRQQTALMQGPGAGVVRPEESTGLAGIDVDVDGTGAQAQKIKDISERMFEARKAALEFETEKEKLKLEFAVRRLRIEESQKGEKEKIIELLELEKQLSDGLAKIDKQRADELKSLFNSFKIKSGGFDFSGIDQGEGPKTPFEALRVGADELTDSLKGALGAAQELATVGLQGISDGITNLVVNGTLNFREFAASLLRDMARIIMQQVVMKSLMQALGFGTNTVEKIDYTQFEVAKPGQFPDMPGLGRGSSKFAGASGAQSFYGVPLPKFAKGGITRGVSIAGEAGPEAVVPLPDGRSIPVTMQGEGTKVVVNVDAQGTAVQGDSGRASELGQVLGAAIRQELLKQKRPGGLLA